MHRDGLHEYFGEQKDVKSSPLRPHEEATGKNGYGRCKASPDRQNGQWMLCEEYRGIS
jgi:hypothetical protein